MVPQSPINIDGTANRVIAHRGSDSCTVGRRRCPRCVSVCVRSGDVIDDESVASCKSSGENIWRKVVIMSTLTRNQLWMAKYVCRGLIPRQIGYFTLP